MTSYMLTTNGTMGARDVRVDGASSILEAILIAEKSTGCRVDHGRGGIGKRFRPALTIDAVSGEITRHHDDTADESMQIVNVFKGIGKR